MDQVIKHVPFELNGKPGIVEVCYEENTSATKSGFDLLQGLGFDINMCIGYPTMHAYIKEYSGTGYYTASAWIQICSDTFYQHLDDEEPVKFFSEVDTNPNMRKVGAPFFALGFPAEIYDAPCNNLRNYAKLTWIADAFLVTQPSRINNDTIQYICGFRWGYEESEVEGKRTVKILPLEVIDQTVWNNFLPLLREKYPDWKFE